MDFNILGALEVRDERGEVSLGGGKQRALLALLLIHPNESRSMDGLIDELWGEQAPATAAKILHNYVSRLRRALGEDRLETQGRGYALRVRPGELDVDRFKQRFEEGRRAMAAGEPERASQRLREALELWRGSALADFAYEPFARDAIGRLEELHLTALIERVDADLALGRDSDLVGELESLVAAHPFQERLVAQLMLALYRSGRQAEALRAYERARHLLAVELGIEPGQALQHLERAILVHDPSLEPPTIATSTGDPTAEAVTRRSRARLAVPALLLAVAAAVAGVLVARGRGDTPTSAVPPRSVVAAIDPNTNKLVGAVPVGNLPTRIAAGIGQVWAMSSVGGTISKINARTLNVSANIAVNALGFLSSVALGADQGWVAYGGVLAVISPEAPVTLIRFDRNGFGDLPDVAADKGSVWVTSQNQRAVIRVDRASLRVDATVSARAVPRAVAVAGGSVWVAGFDKSSSAGVLVRIDSTRGTVSATIPLPGIPGDLATGYGGVWVIANSENAVWRIDPATGSVVRTIQVGSGPVAVAAGEGSVWVANAKDGTVSRIDPATNKIVATIPVGGSPRDVAVGSGRVWAAVL